MRLPNTNADIEGLHALKLRGQLVQSSAEAVQAVSPEMGPLQAASREVFLVEPNTDINDVCSASA